jgi:hypothetical protein
MMFRYSHTAKNKAEEYLLKFRDLYVIYWQQVEMWFSCATARSELQSMNIKASDACKIAKNAFCELQIEIICYVPSIKKEEIKFTDGSTVVIFTQC